MMTPTLAGSAARVASIISTLHPASPTTASPASHSPFPPGRAGQPVPPQPRPGSQQQPSGQVTDGLAAQKRVAA